MSANKSDVLAQLKAILTPDLLSRIYDIQVPARGASPQTWFDLVFGDEAEDVVRQKLRDVGLLSVLAAISRIDIEELCSIRWLHLLPSANSREFLTQSLGLHLLLDQGSRLLLKGCNIRYVYGFFDILALKLASEFDALPDALKPWSLQRWLREGYTWQDALPRCVYYNTALCHAEDPMHHARGQQICERHRVDAERASGRPDPTRTNPDAHAIEAQVDALIQLVTADVIPPRYLSRESYEDFVYFDCQIVRVHKPVIDKFGRYPWRNAGLGRQSTAEELAFLDSIDGFAKVVADVARQISEDVADGRWRLLIG